MPCVVENYDVVVVGGGIAGCSTAYTSAKQGLKTVLIEKNSFLGGSLTAGLVVPAMKSSDNQINTEFFEALTNELKLLGGQITYLDGNSGWFNPILAKIALDNLLTSVGVELLFSTNITNITTKDDKITNITLSSKSNIMHNNLSSSIETSDCNNNDNLQELSEPIETGLNEDFSRSNLSVSLETRYVVDATGELDVCSALNCKFIDDNGRNQPASLRFIAGGVDLKTFAEYILDLDSDRNATTATCINGEYYLSTACTWDKNWALSPIFEIAVAKGVLQQADRAYFQIFTIPGMTNSIAFNCPRIPDIIDTKDIKAKSKALINARKAILRTLEFCKQYLPGFQKAYISSIASDLGVRVSPRALGKYLYTIDDLKSGKKFDNPVLVSNYPIDVHSDKKEGAVLEKLYQEYQLPVESLQSIDYGNLFFVGRSISADFYAQAALRIIPSVASMGEGLAKYLAKLSD